MPEPYWPKRKGSYKLTDGNALLSSYPATKVMVHCDVCGMRVQYDKQAMLAKGGDRRLLDLLDEIRQRKACPKMEAGIDPFDRCRAVYANLVNAYKSASDGR